ncbi:MAG: LytTR family transcriptional regulator [Bacteroides sp.]|nr:LytTR family transcriptional regulator [Bacteroides sp.]MBD5306017.1 LytTR family transcriptional regulator [Bacteroides sp.]
MESLSLKSGHQFIEVDIGEITHLEAMDNYVKIYRREKPLVITQITMKEMERRLPADRFRRVHRSYIIALDQIEKYAHRKIFCRQPDLRIPVGRKYLPDFLDYYRSNFENPNADIKNESGQMSL